MDLIIYMSKMSSVNLKIIFFNIFLIILNRNNCYWIPNILWFTNFYETNNRKKEIQIKCF